MKTYPKEELDEILVFHKKWLNNEPNGIKADFSKANLRFANLGYANLRYANLSEANLGYANLRYANLSEANLSNADLRFANLSDANLSKADLGYANLSEANLSGANLSEANLGYANLRYANLRYANLSNANLSEANLGYANLSGANLSEANLRFADFSKAKGLFDMIDWLNASFHKTDNGYVVYKCFSGSYSPNPDWAIKQGSIISENCNPNITEDCGCGINVATMEWVKENYPNMPIWSLLIRFEWLVGAVIPLNTKGEFRCSRAELIEIVV
ncbi:MAG: pentapeptide repeat-containing protein [Planktothrix sp.]